MKTRHSPQPVSKGFTLLELIVALALAGIIFSIAIPSFSNFISRQKIATDVNEIISILRISRSQSIKSRKITNLTLSNTEKDGWQILVLSDGKTDIYNSEDSSIVFSNIGPGNGNKIKFDSMGARIDCDINSECTIRIKKTNYNDESSIIISRAGSIYVK